MSSPWSKVRLGECCEIVSGATPSTTVDTFWGGEVCWATPKDLSELEGAYISNTPRKLTQAGLENCSAAILPPGSVLFSSRAPIGHVAVNTVPMATNQGFKSFVPKKIVAAKFLYWWLKANRGYLESLGNGATFKEVSKAIVSRIEIPLPPLSDQRRIADVLDRAEALRAKRRAALAELDELTQSIFLDMFGDPAAQIRRFPIQPLAALLGQPLQNGAYYPKESYTDVGGVEMVHMSDAFYEIVPRGNLKRVVCPASDIEKYALSELDVLIARRSLTLEGAAKPCLIPKSNEPLIFESSFIRVTPHPHKVSALYLYHYLGNERVKQKCIQPYITQSTISGINQSNLARVPIIVPPIPLQREFADRVAGVDRLKAAQRASLAELDELFASLQHRAFRGEL